MFQQDSAPTHRVHDTIELLERKTPDFISPDLWPSNSPDLNPFNYKLWEGRATAGLSDDVQECG